MIPASNLSPVVAVECLSCGRKIGVFAGFLSGRARAMSRESLLLDDIPHPLEKLFDVGKPRFLVARPAIPPEGVKLACAVASSGHMPGRADIGATMIADRTKHSRHQFVERGLVR